MTTEAIAWLASEPEPYARYLDLLRDGQIPYQRCAACDVAIFYPRVLCPSCGGGELLWKSSIGRGVVYSTTAVSERDGSAYCVCLVDLDEGYRMMGTVLGVPAQDVRIGERVVARVDLRAGDQSDAGNSATLGPRVVFELEVATDDL